MFTGLGALRFHTDFKALFIKAVAVFFNDVSGQVDRKTVGVIEFEDGFAGNNCLSGFL